jgi:hypothetical protein
MRKTAPYLYESVLTPQGSTQKVRFEMRGILNGYTKMHGTVRGSCGTAFDCFALLAEDNTSLLRAVGNAFSFRAGSGTSVTDATLSKVYNRHGKDWGFGKRPRPDYKATTIGKKVQRKLKQFVKKGSTRVAYAPMNSSDPYPALVYYNISTRQSVAFEAGSGVLGAAYSRNPSAIADLEKARQ